MIRNTYNAMRKIKRVCKNRAFILFAFFACNVSAKVGAQTISDEVIVIGAAVTEALDNLPSRPLYFRAGNLMFKDTSTSIIRALGTAIVWKYEKQTEGDLHIPHHVKVGFDRFEIKGLAEGCLANCDMSSVNIPLDTRTIPARCFSTCSNLRQVAVPDRVTFVEMCAFKWCSSLKSIDFPSGLKYIGEACFEQSGLETFTVPKSVEFIGKRAFANCKALRSITFTGHRVGYIDGEVFENCDSLTDITLPVGCTTIYSYAFRNSGLKRLSLPPQMQAIYTKAFEGTALEHVDCHAQNPPKIAMGTFTEADVKRIELHVPAGREQAYRSVGVWNRFAKIIADL